VTRGRSPEEFFEVFREVQETKKRQGDTTDAEDAPAKPEPARPDTPVMNLADREPLVDRLSDFFARTVTISYTIVATSAVAVILLLMAAYMLGKQSGWSSHAAAVKSAVQEPGEAEKEAIIPTLPPSTSDFVDGRILTLATLGTQESHRKNIQDEADNLNRDPSFTSLGLTAFAYKDRAGRYRLAARGLDRYEPARREQVIQQVRRIKSKRGKLEYATADLMVP
jgi:hypothetical protein